jgi:hypothetical protein
VKKHSLNPQQTLAILIGISKYAGFQDIDPALGNVQGFVDILKDQAIFGIPEKNIKHIIGGVVKK